MNELAELPILMSARSVVAILAGRKRQTRRLIRLPRCYGGPDQDGHYWHRDDGSAVDIRSESARRHCPFGPPGRQLWVREPFYTFAPAGSERPAGVPTIVVRYEADDQRAVLPAWRYPWDASADGRRRPGMFMPRAASRLGLEVEWIRAERFSEITPAGAGLEGFESVEEFRREFGLLHGRRLEKELPDPWVWVIQFAVAWRAGGGRSDG